MISGSILKGDILEALLAYVVEELLTVHNQ